MKPLLITFVAAIGLGVVQDARSLDLVAEYDVVEDGDGWKFKSGTLDGKPYESVQYPIGDFTYEDGTIGGEPFSCVTQHFGKFSIVDCD